MDMYTANQFLDKSLQIISKNIIKSNSIKNYFLKNIMNNEYVSQFLGYLSELEYDLETLNNYISDFQLVNNNMIQNLEESSIKRKNDQNEINRLKRALNKANDEIHNLKDQNNYIQRINRENNNRKNLIINEDEKNVDDNESKFNYFRNYLNSTPYQTFGKTSKNNRQNLKYDIDNDICGRYTYYRKENEDNKLNDKDNTNQKNLNIRSYNKNCNKINNNDIYKNNVPRKSQSLNKTRKIIKNDNNNNFIETPKKEINKIKNKTFNNKNIPKNFDGFRNRNDLTSRFHNNEDIKEYMNERHLNNTNIMKNYNSQPNLNCIDNSIKNRSQSLSGKIITHNNTMISPINQINQINYETADNPMIKNNYSTYDFPREESALILSKRMQNYIHNQNLKKRFDEISKNSLDVRQNRINDIIRIISENKDKLNELKFMFGNNIEAQILNGDLSDDYLNKIENILYYMEKTKSIIPLSKRFQIQSNSSKKKKIINNEENNINSNNIKTARFVRKKLRDKNYNKNNIKRWNTTKNFFGNKN